MEVVDVVLVVGIVKVIEVVLVFEVVDVNEVVVDPPGYQHWISLAWAHMELTMPRKPGSQGSTQRLYLLGNYISSK